MIPKYTVDYTARLRDHAHPGRYSTDDPVAVEQFLHDLLDHGYGIQAIRHEGAELPRKEADRMIKTAAATLAAHRICAALNIKPDEERHRFGFTA